MMLFLILAIMCASPDVYQVTLRPFDFQDENNPETFLGGIKQVESNGEHLFVVPLQQPAVFEIDETGKFIRRIGRRGPGPEEWGEFQPQAIAVNGHSMWVLLGDRRNLHYYEKGEFVLRFRTDPYQFTGTIFPAYRIAFDNNHVAVQAFPGYGKLANVYNYGGEKVAVMGDILAREPKFLGVNPGLNNTIWVKAGKFWYGLFVHRPILRKFDETFKLVREFILDGPEIDHFETIYFEAKKNPRFTYPLPHFMDMKFFRGHLYLMCDGVLYQVDPDSGKVLSRTIAFHEIDGVRERGGKHFVAFLDSGAFVTAHRSPYLGHDMWIADLPFLVKKPSTP